jgi:AIPR protein
MDLADYAEEMFQETLATAEAGTEGFRLEIFTSIVAEQLSEAGEFSDFTLSYHRARGLEVSGWSLEEDTATLHLAITDYRGDPGLPSLTNTQIDTSFRRLGRFAEKATEGYADELEESSPIFELADLIRSSWTKFERVRFYIFSDALAKSPTVGPVEIAGVPVTHHVWDIERLFRLDSSGLTHEPIGIDVVARLGSPIPCLEGPNHWDHRVYLLLVPGRLLADIYNEFGTRLLERNVRSFLQARGAVNKGIRETLLNEPGRFLAYNNGLSATAAKVNLVDLPEGGKGVSYIDDLQIVNGGQTTASIAATKRKDMVDLSAIQLQTKLTVVDADLIDELVAKISKYANTQNKVTGADFSANDPFFVRLEALARSVWAPAVDGSQKQTRWFFERARGQYADDLARSGTPASQKRFKITNPAGQKFTKPDVAKFEHSWEQLPHLVSLGAEKNFREFVLRLSERPVTPDEGYFQRLVAKAILFRSTERIVSAQKFGGYRANIVTYSIAKLSHATANRIDLDRIWRTQELSEALSDTLAELSHLIVPVLLKPGGGATHVGEWCKKPDCWARVRELEWAVPPAVKSQLIKLRDGQNGANEVDRGIATVSDEESILIDAAAAIEADTWFRLSNWAKETESLLPWQRGLAYSLGRLAARGARPSVKQARQGLLILETGMDLGFR